MLYPNTIMFTDIVRHDLHRNVPVEQQNYGMDTLWRMLWVIAEHMVKT